MTAVTARSRQMDVWISLNGYAKTGATVNTSGRRCTLKEYDIKTADNYCYN